MQFRGSILRRDRPTLGPDLAPPEGVRHRRARGPAARIATALLGRRSLSAVLDVGAWTHELPGDTGLPLDGAPHGGRWHLGPGRGEARGRPATLAEDGREGRRDR